MAKLMLGTSAIAPSISYVQEVEGMPAYIPTSKGYRFENNVLTSYTLTHNQYSTYPATDIGDNLLAHAFSTPKSNMGEKSYQGDSNLVAVNLDSLTKVSGSQAFMGAFAACPNLATISIKNLKKVEGNKAFSNAFCGTWQYMDEETWEEKPGIHPAFTSVSFDELEEITGEFTFENCFWCCENMTSLAFPKLKKVSGNRIFNYLIGYCQIVEITFSCLEEIGGTSTFAGMASYSGQTSPATGGKTGPATIVNFPALKKVTATDTWSSVGKNNKTYTSVGLDNLEYVDGVSAMSGFMSGATLLETATLPKLSTLKGNYAFSSFFSSCTSLTSVSFPALNANSFGSSTNQFNQMLKNCSGVTVHFPANLQSVISSWSDVTSGFGGTNTTVLYDLPIIGV